MTKKRTPAGRPESKAAPKGSHALDPARARTVRLNKYLAQNGIASRRQADEKIARGDVMIDGRIVTELGRQVDPARERVEVDGVILRPEGERHRYYLLNKPAGVVCTNDHREARTRAIDLITDRKKGRIYTVGRLDEETIGIVILTNDGELANRVSHPRYGVEKTYRVTIGGRISDEKLQKLRGGVRLSDFRSSFSSVRIVKRTDVRSVLTIVLREGKNREIRRVFARIGLPVRDLRRVRVGNLTDRGLKVGHWRPLTPEEVRSLLERSGQAKASSGTEERRRPRPKSKRRAATGALRAGRR